MILSSHEIGLSLILLWLFSNENVTVHTFKNINTNKKYNTSYKKWYNFKNTTYFL